MRAGLSGFAASSSVWRPKYHPINEPDTQSRSQQINRFIWGIRRRVRELLLCVATYLPHLLLYASLPSFNFGIVAVIVEPGCWCPDCRQPNIGSRSMKRNRECLAESSESVCTHTSTGIASAQFWTWDKRNHSPRTLALQFEGRIGCARADTNGIINAWKSGSVRIELLVFESIELAYCFHCSPILQQARTMNNEYRNGGDGVQTFCSQFVLVLIVLVLIVLVLIVLAIMLLSIAIGEGWCGRSLAGDGEISGVGSAAAGAGAISPSEDGGVTIGRGWFFFFFWIWEPLQCKCRTAWSN